MPRVTVPAVTIRTTSDSKGHPHGIVTGMSLSPELALIELKQGAQTQAEKAARPYSTTDPPPRVHPPPTAKVPPMGTRVPTTPLPKEWRFEVVDVRLAPAMIEGKNGWLAYGTLLSEGEKPR
jgi:hypothetical protein